MKDNNSNSLTNDDIFYIYNKLLRINTVNPIKNYKGDSTNPNDLREAVVKNPSKALSGTKIINTILYKIVLISWLKYRYEVILIDKLNTKFYYPQSELEKIVKANGLLNKIKKAINIEKTIKFGADVFLNECLNIHYKYKDMYNSFDHGLANMFPPYLSIGIRDIKKFKLALDNLNNKY